jgi:hypothetical protein
MFKKENTFLSIVLTFVAFASAAQTAVSSTTLVTDTLHYYLNKQFLKGGTSLQNLPVYKPSSAAANPITHCGSVFENHDVIYITGLEIYTVKQNFGGNVAPLHLYLCGLTNDGKPDWPPIDSIVLQVAKNPTNEMKLYGGNFVETKTLTSGFAVLARNMSVVSIDTIYIPRTASKSATSSGQPFQKYSDGNGYVRYNGQFYSTNGFTLAPGFGPGTDYEFLLAPRVQYNLKAEHIKAPLADPSDTVCTRTLFTYINNSSFHYTHKMYNLNAFYTHWHLSTGFLAQPPSGFSADSAITWFFEPDDNLVPARDPRRQLCSGCNSVSYQTDVPGCFNSNSFRARLTPMSAFGRGQQMFYNEHFTICMKYCNQDALAIENFQHAPSISVYPNPASDQITVKGMGQGEIRIYDALGSLLCSIEAREGEIKIATGHLSSGVYFMVIKNEEGNDSRHPFIVTR